MSTKTLSMDEVLEWAAHLPVQEQAYLAERLIARVAHALSEAPSPPLSSSAYGALADLGPAPSAEEIDEVRREMWANVGEGDDY